MEQPTDVTLPDGNTVKVTLIDANHAPGAVMFIFEGNFGDDVIGRFSRIVYTGDFRYVDDDGGIDSRLNAQILLNPMLRQPFDTAYIDTTYLDYRVNSFPSEAEVMSQIVQAVLRHPKHCITIGLPAVGKEELINLLHAALPNEVIYVDSILHRYCNILQNLGIYDRTIRFEWDRGRPPHDARLCLGSKHDILERVREYHYGVAQGMATNELFIIPSGGAGMTQYIRAPLAGRPVDSGIAPYCWCSCDPDHPSPCQRVVMWPPLSHHCSSSQLGIFLQLTLPKQLLPLEMVSGTKLIRTQQLMWRLVPGGVAGLVALRESRRQKLNMFETSPDHMMNEINDMMVRSTRPVDRNWTWPVVQDPRAVLGERQPAVQQPVPNVPVPQYQPAGDDRPVEGRRPVRRRTDKEPRAKRSHVGAVVGSESERGSQEVTDRMEIAVPPIARTVAAPQTNVVAEAIVVTPEVTRDMYLRDRLNWITHNPLAASPQRPLEPVTQVDRPRPVKSRRIENVPALSELANRAVMVQPAPVSVPQTAPPPPERQHRDNVIVNGLNMLWGLFKPFLGNR